MNRRRMLQALFSAAGVVVGTALGVKALTSEVNETRKLATGGPIPKAWGSATMRTWCERDVPEIVVAIEPQTQASVRRIWFDNELVYNRYERHT